MSNSEAWPPLQGVIFDMDGVLVDSEPFIKEAAVRMFAEKGFKVQAEDFTPFVGTGAKDISGVHARCARTWVRGQGGHQVAPQDSSCGSPACRAQAMPSAASGAARRMSLR